MPIRRQSSIVPMGLARALVVPVIALGALAVPVAAGANDAEAAQAAPAATAPADGERASSYRLTDEELKALDRRGKRVTYRVTASNPTSRTARGIEICQRLDRGVRLISASRGYELRDDRVCWTRTLRAKGRVTLRIVGRTMA